VSTESWEVQPLLFVAVGSLACFGVIFLVGQLHVYWFIPLAAIVRMDSGPNSTLQTPGNDGGASCGTDGGSSCGPSG